MYPFGVFFEMCILVQKNTLIDFFFLPCFQDRHNTPAVVLACNEGHHPGDRQASSKWFRN